MGSKLRSHRFMVSALPRSRAATTTRELVPIAGFYGLLVQAQ
jgi:hypothetical protein